MKIGFTVSNLTVSELHRHVTLYHLIYVLESTLPMYQKRDLTMAANCANTLRQTAGTVTSCVATHQAAGAASR